MSEQIETGVSRRSFAAGLAVAATAYAANTVRVQAGPDASASATASPSTLQRSLLRLSNILPLHPRTLRKRAGL
jgi:hypothetical protein